MTFMAVNLNIITASLLLQLILIELILIDQNFIVSTKNCYLNSFLLKFLYGKLILQCLIILYIDEILIIKLISRKNKLY